jgi:bifunctional non-homologous end joining protein LigD
MVLRFIPPASPRRRDRPPVSDRWIHEVKFDGYRIQVHKAGRDVTLLSRNGHHFTGRFPDIAFVLRALPAKAAIIEAELVGRSSTGIPDFRRLHASAATSDELCLWAFDLLHLNGKDLLDQPLVKRRAKLQALIERHDHPTILFSSAFDDDPLRLLAACEERCMEGIVSKRIDAPYRSGDASDWIKVKCAGWREANKERWRLFEPNRP